MLPIIILFSLFFGAEVYGELAPLFRTGDNAIPGEYLVLLKPDTTQSLEQRLIGIDQHMRIMRRNKEIDISSKFEFLSFAAFSVVATEEAIEELRSVLIVELIQENTLITINGVKWESEVDLGECAAQDTSKDGVIMWGLTRTSSEKRANYSTGYYHYDEQGGRDVSAYIIDSGIYMEHEEFRGRVIWGYTAVNLVHEGHTDLDGHGTHVAGTVGGSTFGIAKMVRLIAVKVFDKEGTATATSTIEGVLWACKHFVENRQRNKRYKGVVNMSLGGPIDPIQDALITECTDAGLTFVVASGNEDVDACLTSPARISSAITVGATSPDDTLADFSNYGSCVDILAPGVNIISAGITGPTSTKNLQGTSMAAPHVTGVIARYLSGHNENPSPHQINAWLLDMAAKDDIEIDVNKMTTANRMLYMPCASGIIQVRTDAAYDDSAVVALLAVILTFVILLFIGALILLSMKTGVFTKLSSAVGRPRELPYTTTD